MRRRYYVHYEKRSFYVRAYSPIGALRQAQAYHRTKTPWAWVSEVRGSHLDTFHFIHVPQDMT